MPINIDEKTLEEAIAPAIIEMIRKELNAIGNPANLSLVRSPFYMGNPSDKHLRMIHQYTGDSSSVSEDWFVCCVLASDNLINRGKYRWTLDVLQAMSERSNGIPLIADHEWDDSEDIYGFIFDGFLQSGGMPGKQAVGMEDYNAEIITNEGYQAYYAWCAIAVNQDVVESIKQRRAQYVSTGGMVTNSKIICPICTKEAGREIGVYDMNAMGEFICPHNLPGRSYYSDDDPSMEMPYYVMSGDYDPVEISYVVSGNLPNAMVIR